MALKTAENSITLYLKFIDQAFNKKAWHGPTLRGALRGVSYKEALWRPSPKHHNIWELTIHAAYWKYVVRRKITGEARGSFALEGSNWLALPKTPSAKAWHEAIGLLENEHKMLRYTIASMPSAEIEHIDAKNGMICGIASHDLYHAGQIQLLKRLIRGGAAKAK